MYSHCKEHNRESEHRLGNRSKAEYDQYIRYNLIDCYRLTSDDGYPDETRVVRQYKGYSTTIIIAGPQGRTPLGGFANPGGG